MLASGCGVPYICGCSNKHEGNGTMENQRVKFAYKCSTDPRGYATGHPGALNSTLQVGQVIKVVHDADLSGIVGSYFLRIVSADYDKYEAEKFVTGHYQQAYRGYSYESNMVFFK